VIRAACYPPGDDLDADQQLKPVIWGVVKGRFGESVRHCHFTSEGGTESVEGEGYS
jgi:hypothetical protein